MPHPKYQKDDFFFPKQNNVTTALVQNNCLYKVIICYFKTDTLGSK